MSEIDTSQPAQNELPMDNPVYGSYLKNLKELKVGAGDEQLYVGKDGLHMGANTFVDAPFSVSYLGALIAAGATISGTINANSGTFTGTITVSGNIVVGSGTITVGSGTETIVLDGTSGDMLFKNSGTTVGQLGVSAGTTVLNGAGTDLYIINSGSGAIAMTSQSGSVFITSNSADVSLDAGDDLFLTSAGDTSITPGGDVFIVSADLFVDGEVTADAYNDLAEYFEATKEFSKEKISLGTTVVLEGEKIRPAKDGEQPIGAISKTAGIIMGSQKVNWQKKFKRSDFGEFEKDSNGDRVVDSAFDETKVYIPRSERPEWNVVGLVGKVRIRKGQPVADRWIKLRDVSETVEEWLIR